MTGKDVSLIGPVSAGERILSLDVLRGFALFGILAVNIYFFGMLFMSLPNPTAFGDLTGLNYGVAMFTYIFAQQKFMTLFSLLFGAGILLMARKIEEKGGKAARRHYLRMMWLFLIGMLHAYVLWYGDILVSYALCALLVYLFRKMSARKLLIIGLIVVCIGSLIMVLLAWSLPHWPQEMLEFSRQSWQPGEEAIAGEIAAYRGGWWEQMSHRVLAALSLQTNVFLIFTLWRAGGLMLIGMALLKWGVLTGRRGTGGADGAADNGGFDFKKLYWKFLIIGTGAGLAIQIAGWFANTRNNWSMEYSMLQGQQFNYWGSLFLSMAYIGGIMLICQAKKLSFFTGPLAAAGRMAFTNYLVQTIICTTIFYGHGFGLFGKVERIGLFLIVFLIFGFQLWFSQLWLKHFRFGPFEWVWRSLTYRKMQPMKI